MLLGREVADWEQQDLVKRPASGLEHGGDLDPVQDEWPGKVVTGDYSNSGFRDEGGGSYGLDVAADEADPLGGSDQDRTMPSATSSSPSQSRAHEDVAKKWKCPYCVEAFRLSKEYKRHLATHIDKKRPYKHKCESCEQCFTSKQHLARHRLLHTGERPYQCAECSKSFTTKFNLDLHFSRVHLAERPHQCQLCNRRFAVKSDLAAHLKKPKPCV
ncbi:hypothetical protein FOCC_FOCC017653 [Frankliniella occidentalis]|nr:hypothetical protein FOCC_FOCC017653 [Frankliniella occidentalis]